MSSPLAFERSFAFKYEINIKPQKNTTYKNSVTHSSSSSSSFTPGERERAYTHDVDVRRNIKKCSAQNKNNNNNSTEVLSNTQKKFIEHTRNMNMNLNVSQCCSALSSRYFLFFYFILFFSRVCMYLRLIASHINFFLLLISSLLLRASLVSVVACNIKNLLYVLRRRTKNTRKKCRRVYKNVLCAPI